MSALKAGRGEGGREIVDIGGGKCSWVKGIVFYKTNSIMNNFAIVCLNKFKKRQLIACLQTPSHQTL